MISRKYKYPIGIQTFADIREGGYIYIDKTGYVFRLAQNYRTRKNALGFAALLCKERGARKELFL
jgi:hypothetical protein